MAVDNYRRESYYGPYIFILSKQCCFNMFSVPSVVYVPVCDPLYSIYTVEIRRFRFTIGVTSYDYDIHGEMASSINITLPGEHNGESLSLLYVLNGLPHHHINGFVAADRSFPKVLGLQPLLVSMSLSNQECLSAC
jgi:hypothetical protein